MKTVAIVQARMGSKRFPNKVMKLIDGKPLIELLLKRLQKSKTIDQIILATSVAPDNQPLVDHALKLGVGSYRGSENDVLSRFHEAAKKYEATIVVRITGDCPLVDSELVDECISKFQLLEVDYLSNTEPATFPDGLDIEVFKFSALEQANAEVSTSFDREHVTPYLRRSVNFKKFYLNNEIDLSGLRWTVDEAEDFEVIKNVFKHFTPEIYFGWKQVLQLAKDEPEIFKANSEIERNEGATMNSGQKLWKRARKVIPGGNMLLSKRAEMFLPDQWPSYFSKAKGCHVWDLDSNEYIDMCIMGIGTNILGYGHPEIDEVVNETIRKGNMSTLNCPEEVYLAEKLVELHPWADMVRFARSGGEANAIAIRIARAASGKDQVAVCGYHGWHDWYLSANLGDYKNLDGHLLPGLEPKGVPRNLKNTVFPFEYNNYEELEKIIAQNEIGVIKMEVTRSGEPENNFLQKVRKLATDRNIILIFDECTSGFRQSFGGIHKIYNVEPDMAMFGKALGNGYAITATIGKKEIMEAAQSTFISSTFWTERIGPSAALKSLEVMERLQSWDVITDMGRLVRAKTKDLADKYQLQISQWGLPALTGYAFNSTKALEYKTFITQEMLKKGFLVGNSVYVCIDHTLDIVNDYFENLDPVFEKICKFEDGEDVYKYLEGPICHSGFKRLN